MAAPFDARRAELTGDAVPVAEGLATDRFQGNVTFSVSGDGSLVYVAGDSGVGGAGRELVWVTRSGEATPIPGAEGALFYPQISPDGARVALDNPSGADDILVWDFGTRTLRRMILGGGGASYPVWTPEGERIAFVSQDGNVYWKASNNTGEVELLVSDIGEAGDARALRPYFFTPDGSALVSRHSSNVG